MNTEASDQRTPRIIWVNNYPDRIPVVHYLSKQAAEDNSTIGCTGQLKFVEVLDTAMEGLP